LEIILTHRLLISISFYPFLLEKLNLFGSFAEFFKGRRMRQLRKRQGKAHAPNHSLHPEPIQ